MADDGLHALVPGTGPDPQTLDELTRRYQRHCIAEVGPLD
jgi:hypothetical protein